MISFLSRSVEAFLRHTYGRTFAEGTGAAPDRQAIDGDAMGFVLPLLQAAGAQLHKPVEELTEDWAAWLARHEAVRRLLRFSGAEFRDFIAALGELPGRVRMVLPANAPPRVRVVPQGEGPQQLVVEGADIWAHFLAGMVRAMADDYGSLALVSVEGSTVMVDVSLDRFVSGRGFDLVSDVA
ncbi:heme NO-binding protein [Paracoccus jiaweipingae]|uniref:heme NO-binding protein n=1 Tax=unclassified Paracoccus (in: a-proteobacteria) TaxID=2688777 RepID=UPI00379ED423